MGVGLILIGVVCFAHANQMDDVVQALILEASEESLEDVESTLLKLGSVAVDSLIRLLASDDSALRMTAVRVLGSMDHSIDEKLFQVLSVFLVLLALYFPYKLDQFFLSPLVLLLSFSLAQLL